MRTITLFLTIAALGAGCGQAASTGKTASPGTNPDTPVSHTTDPGGRVMMPQNPTWVVGQPGGGPLTRVSPTTLRVGVADGAPYAVVRWWSGVEPCYVLRPVDVDVAGTTVRLRLVEGSDNPNAACIELAMLKATRIDLGSLAPGSYTVVAGGKRAQLQV